MLTSLEIFPQTLNLKGVVKLSLSITYNHSGNVFVGCNRTPNHT